MITTRLRDTAFKRVLQAMPLGTAVKIEGPFGDLRLHHADRPAVVLTGGIGITPFRSILLETIRTGGLPYPVVVFYANRRPQDAAFLDELRELGRAGRRTSPSFRRCRGWTLPDAWEGERGHIDASMLGTSPRRRDQRHLLPDRPARNGPWTPNDARRGGRRRGRHPDRGIHRLLKGSRTCDSTTDTSFPRRRGR